MQTASVNPEFTIAHAKRELRKFDKRTDLRRFFCALTSDIASTYLLFLPLVQTLLVIHVAQREYAEAVDRIRFSIGFHKRVCIFREYPHLI